MFDYSRCKEVISGLMSVKEAEEMGHLEEVSRIEHKSHPLLLGNKVLLKVNTNIGVSNKDALTTELKKLETISKLSYRPDSMMDHTFVQLEKPFWKYMVEIFDGPIGTLPHYTAFDPDKGIDANNLIEIIDEMGAFGVKFMTVHLTATKRMLHIAQKYRKVPTTSRGGSIILKDLEINKRRDNVLVDYLPEILHLFRKYNMTISVGTTFRPARIDEALDTVQIEEIKMQKMFIDIIKKSNVNVIMEGVGHLSLCDIPIYCDYINHHNAPLMPLGPMVTDATVGFDHVTAAIGATVISMYGNVGMINSVTREEHTGGVPSMDSIIEGLKAARVSSHAINLLRFKAVREIDSIVSDKRATKGTCAIKGGIFDENNIYSTSEGCNRCRYECPLNIIKL